MLVRGVALKDVPAICDVREPDRAAPCLYLGMLQVRADSQGQGVGRRLIEDGVAIARDEGCDALRTGPDSSAVGFYDRCGFAPTRMVRKRTAPLPGPSWTATPSGRFPDR